MFRIVPLCIALIVAVPIARLPRCYYPSDRELCSLTKAPDAMIQGCSAIINRGTDKDLQLAYNNRCLAYEDRGDHDRAIADCDQAIKLDPQYTNPYTNRGRAYMQKGDNDQAITDYDKAIELNPKESNAYDLRGIAYRNKGDNDRAIVDFDKAVELDPKNAKAYFNRGLAYGRKGDRQQGIADIRKAATLDPGNEGFKKILSDLGEKP